MKSLRLVIIGPPACGKGTISSLVSASFNLPHISSGDVLRAANKTTSNGSLVSDNLILSIVLPLLPHNGFILDGFPRTTNQAVRLNKHLADSHAHLDAAVVLDVPVDVLQARIRDRLIHPPSGRTYNLNFNPPKTPFKDDLTNEPLIKRPDDCPEIFRNRLNAFETQTKPLIDFYAKQGILRTFSGSSSSEIFSRVKSALSSILAEQLQKQNSIENHKDSSEMPKRLFRSDLL